MINIRGIANQAIQSINPDVLATLKRSDGYETRAGGLRVPKYTTFTDVRMQAQAMSFGDLQQLDGLNIQGVRRAIYTDGALFGVLRAAQKGGDILIFPTGTFPEGDTWLCVHVLEQWSTWVKVAITLQDGP